MLELLGEAQLDRDSARRARRNRRQRRLVARLTRAEEEELRVEREIAWIAEDQIESFLGDETRRHREDRNARYPSQPNFLLECLSTRLFSLE